MQFRVSKLQAIIVSKVHDYMIQISLIIYIK